MLTARAVFAHRADQVEGQSDTERHATGAGLEEHKPDRQMETSLERPATVRTFGTDDPRTQLGTAAYGAARADGQPARTRLQCFSVSLDLWDRAD